MAIFGIDLKTVLSGLAHQDAGDYLPLSDKMKALGSAPGVGDKPATSPRHTAKKAATHRIALINDGRRASAPLNYVIEACERQGAVIDLLVHGEADPERTSGLESSIRTAGIDCHRIQLGPEPVDDIVTYIRNHSALIFLVAMPDDPVAKVLIEEVIPKRGGRLPVPLVLIEDLPSGRLTSQSAA